MKVINEYGNHKGALGVGMEHAVYASTKNPNIVYKVGKGSKVKEWYEVFKKYPDVFPKVGKIFRLKNHPDYYAVEVEKLNTKGVVKEFDKVEGYLFDYTGQGAAMYGDMNPNDINSALKAIDQDFSTPLKFRQNAVKWFKFLLKMDKIVSSVKPVGFPDFHGGNFGYDSNGNLKCLDY